ncbi:unnamed protein product, partial [Sphacelaria rigidula]
MSRVKACRASMSTPTDSNLKKVSKKANEELCRVRAHAVESFVETYVSRLEAHIARGDQRSFYRHLKGIDIEGRKPCSSQQQYIRDNKGQLLRDGKLIRPRWVQWFHTLLNTESPRLNPAIIDQLRARLLSTSLDEVPTIDETVDAIRSIFNGKAVGPDELPAELLKIILDGDNTSRPQR